MKLRVIAISLFAGTAIWCFFAWPLPRYLLRGIPSSFSGTENPPARHMIQGDHLQLLYNYWLAADMIRGKTPLFHNLYEFNTGDDAERRSVGCYNMPLSLVFAAGYWAGGRALGFNLLGVFTIWLTFLATWLLVRRFLRDDLPAGLLALLAIVFPFRWTNQLGGSPAAFAMTWVPILMLGIDVAIRDGRWRGGVIAAFAMLFAYWGDTHVYFFSLLLVPLWSVISAIHTAHWHWRVPGHMRRATLALAPLATMILLCVALSWMQKKALTAAVGQGGKRSIYEIMLFTPRPWELFAWTGFGVYLGFVLLGTLGMSVILWLTAMIGDIRRHWRPGLVFALMGVMLYGMVLMALGPRGWDDRQLFNFFQRNVPFYNMIRQPAKILTVFPSFAALAIAIPLGMWLAWRPALRSWLIGTVALLVVGAALEYGLQVKPDICLIDRSQPAYAAVARDAAAAKQAPRALVVPLWPGNSSWASIYEHYVSLYRIRMLNGYRPVIPPRYAKDVFDAYGSVNVGVLSDVQLDGLLARGIRYILLHEDAFPEKVSPFPVMFTRDRLRNNPRLELLRQGENVWAFKIRAAAAAPQASGPPPVACPVINWEFENSQATNCIVARAVRGEEASLVMGEGGRVTLKPFMHWHAPGAQLWVRMRQGGVSAELYDVQGRITATELDAAEDWTWRAVPFNVSGTNLWIRPDFFQRHGNPQLDMALFTADPGKQLDLERIESDEFSLRMPAAAFFHAGYSVPSTQGDFVMLRKDRDPALGVIYGPRLPMGKGRMRVTMRFASDAPRGTVLGTLKVMCGRHEVGAAKVSVSPDGVAVVECELPANLPVEAIFIYARAADMQVLEFVFDRAPISRSQGL